VEGGEDDEEGKQTSPSPLPVFGNFDDDDDDDDDVGINTRLCVEIMCMKGWWK